MDILNETQRDALVDAVVAHLDGFRPERTAERYAVTGLTNGVVTLTIGSAKKGRIEIASTYGDGIPDDDPDRPDMTYGREHPSITVAPDRDPKAIAREITRRLLPAAREYHAANVKALGERVAMRERRAALVQRLDAVINPVASRVPRRSSWLPADKGYGSFEPSPSGKSVAITLTGIDPDVAIAIAELIMGAL
jgi:hypothetical protein